MHLAGIALLKFINLTKSKTFMKTQTLIEDTIKQLRDLGKADDRILLESRTIEAIKNLEELKKRLKLYNFWD